MRRTVVSAGVAALLLAACTAEVPTPGPSAGQSATVTGTSGTAATAATPAAPAVAVTQASVVRVIDGDTAEVTLATGVKEKVRFIGVDTPEVRGRVERMGLEASAFTRAKLPAGRTVWLETDAGLRDRYGRLLAYVWLERPVTGGVDEVRARMLNAMLLLAGYAQLMTIQPNDKYVEVFKPLVVEARTLQVGLWAPEAPA